MSTCNFTRIIDKTECVGNSLNTINTNFTNLDTNLCSLDSTVATLQATIASMQASMQATISGIVTPVITRGATTIFTPSVTKKYIIQCSGTAYFPNNSANGNTVAISLDGSFTTGSFAQGFNWSYNQQMDLPFNLTWQSDISLISGTIYTFGLIINNGSVITTAVGGFTNNLLPIWVIQ